MVTKRSRTHHSIYLFPVSVLALLFLFLSSSSLAEQQFALPDEISASLSHEIPVLHTAFVQIGEELHYLGNQMKPDSNGNLPNGPGARSKASKIAGKTYNVLKMAGKDTLPIEMDPPMLDFGDNSVGSAQKRKIYFRNMINEEIVLDAVYVNSVEFQTSFFENNKLGPREATMVEVAFIPRETGKRETSILFYTSVGIFTYKTTGNCISNPYRISPFSGLRVPVNGSIARPLTLHNPHPFTMQITEISSTGGNAHIEMPYHIDERFAAEPPKLWEIKPFQTKTVANIMLVGGVTENTTSFVRIAAEVKKVHEIQQLPDIFLSIPLEVTKQRGIFANEEILDFGILKADERSDTLSFSVFQYQLGGRLGFEMLYVEKGDPSGIYMEFASVPPIIVYPSSKNNVATGWLVKVAFIASRIEFPDDSPRMKHFTGSIIAVSRGGNYNVSVPFKADVFQGSLKSVENDLALQEDLRPPHQRTVRIENALPFDIAIWNISMSSDAASHFSVRLIDHVVTIREGDSAPVFILKYNKKVPSTFDNAMIYVHTNVSTFRLSIQIFSGRMSIDLTSVDKQAFDFGFVERNDTRTIRFIVWNHNRAVLRLTNLVVPSRQAYRLYEVGIQKRGNIFNDISNDERVEYFEATDVDIPQQSGKIFDLELKVPQDGIVRNGSILFETDYESKLFAVTYNVASGSLQSIPDELAFGQTFPAKLVYRTLQVFNSFDEDMTATRLTTLNQDPRFFFEGFDPNNPPVLRTGRLTNLGRVMFAPRVPCSHEYCYLGFPLTGDADGNWFVHGMTLPANLAEVDSYLYKRQRAKYDALVNSGKHRVNTTVILDTDKAKNIKIKTSAEMIWPRLLTKNSIVFPSTALGNFTIVNLTLSNPTCVPVAVQVIPLVIYPDAEAFVELFRPHLLTPLTEHVEMNETLMFSLRDTELFTLKPDSPVPELREELEATIPHSVPRFTLSLMLKPHMKVRLRLGFLPSDYTLRSSLLIIRNNLTVIEPVVMYGKGGRIGMRVENMEARSKQPLLFEIRHDHLTDCNNPKRLMHKLHSTLTVRRPFQVWNNGEIPFTVTNMSINGVGCENRGFRILNCYPFRLLPNETYALDVAYTPDFLMTINEADLQLYMHMNGSAWIFPLAATVPSDMLEKCHQALPRPPFENIMYYSCVTALIFCFVCVLACAYLEGDRAIACAIRQQYSISRHVFDLNKLVKNAAATTSAQQVVTPSAPPRKESRESTWIVSVLRPSKDAWFGAKILIRVANCVLHCVHWVWKWSLFYRKDIGAESKEEAEKAKGNRNRKKKNPVTMVKKEEAAKVVKKEELQESLPVLMESVNNNKKPVEKEMGNMPLKSQAKVKKSPKPQVTNQKGANRRKSQEQQPKQKPRYSSKKGKQRESTAEPVKVAEFVCDEKEEVKVAEEEEEEEDQEDWKTPTVAEMQPEVSESVGAEGDVQLYQQFLVAGGLPMLNPVWSTPAAQAAMQYMNIWNYGAPLSVEQMQMLLGQIGGDAVAAEPVLPAHPPWRMENDSASVGDAVAAEPVLPAHPPWRMEDDSASVGTQEEAPDWVDEIVIASDAEADFSSMAAASQEFWTDDPRNSRRSPSVASSVGSSTLSRRLDSSGKMKGRRLTIGSEKKKEMKESFAKTPGAKAAEGARDGVLGLDHGYQSSLFSGKMPELGSLLFSEQETFPNAIWGNEATTSQNNDPLSLSDLGMDLGDFANEPAAPYNGSTLFSGREFSLWSDANYDPTTAWSNIGLDANKEEESGKK